MWRVIGVLERRQASESEHDEREAGCSGTASARAMPPRRRATREIRNMPGNAKSTYQPTDFRTWLRCDVAELVPDHDAHLAAREKRPSSIVSQSTTRRLGPIPIASAFGSEVVAPDLLDDDRDRSEVLALLELARPSPQLRVIERLGR